ncbi:hypothetical protein ACFQ46_16835 [Kineococcus sp. GCM10028916]|uniref:hypothetical protein n=1 Tax=Kineococcus sp. GCM10028916 TaxID=3273394 RepID=UPI00362C608F
MSDTSPRSPLGSGADRPPGDHAAGGPAAEPGTAGPETVGVVGSPGADRLARATLLLRQHTDSGWKAIEDTVLARAQTLFRPSAPVRARHAFGDFFIAADVVVAELRQTIDATPQVAAQAITCLVGDDDVLDSVTIRLVVAYGAPLLEVAGRVHRVVLRRLDDLLGELAPWAEDVHTHVHVGDVSNDPRIVT